MQFAMLIYQGTTPLPNTEAWDALPEAEQKQIYADYGAINKNKVVTPGVALGFPADAKTVRVETERRSPPRVPSPASTPPSVATWCSRQRTRLPRSSSLRASQPRGLAARSKSGPSASTGRSRWPYRGAPGCCW